MASTAVDSAASNHLNHLHTDSLPLIDLRLLSQSELLSLSLCSSSSSSLLHCQNDADVATPKIDRSVFNESAGSRKQTFSRLRLAPRNNSQFSSSSHSIRTLPVPHQTTAEQVLDEENSQIISLLKSLFGVNLNNNDNDINLVSVPIHYNDSLKFLDFPSMTNDPLQDVRIGVADYSVETEIKQATIPTAMDDSTNKKRKRGRPRKNESESNFYSNHNNLNHVIASEHKLIERETIAVDDQNVRMEKEKPEEKRDMVMMYKNANEMSVDFVKLGNVEDPFGEELMKRTLGMYTEEELLGFLQGLEGEWVSNRRKKKIIDASLLGDVLPRGWKLMLCIKKKAGYSWIACRRYISPNGQQFTSSKEVSSYLLSLFGLQDAKQSSFGHIDGNFQFTDKISSGSAADVTLKVDKNGDELGCCLALPVTSKSVEDENQASSLKIRIPGQAQAVRKYKCHKCTMSFHEPDDLLQHLLSSHQRAPKRLRHGTSMNEEVIIKNGKYECQFCDKPFEERHRYNGHLGNHIKDYFKRIESSNGAMTIQRGIVPPSEGVCPDILNIQEPNGLNLGHIANSDIKINDEINSAIPDYKLKESTTVESCCGEQDTFSSMANDTTEEMNEVTNVIAVENNVGPDADSALVNNESDSICKSSGETNVLPCTTDTLNNFGGQEEGSQNCPLAAVGRDQAHAVNNDVDQVHTNFKEEHSQERGSDSGLLALNFKQKTFDGKNIKDNPASSSINGMEIDERVFVGKDKLSTGFGNNSLGREDFANNIKEQTIFEGYLAVPSDSEQRHGSVNNVHVLSNSITVENARTRGSKGGLFSSLVEKKCISNNIVNQVSTSTEKKSKLDEVFNSTNDVQTLKVEDPMIINELESSSGSRSIIVSGNEQMCFTGNNMNGTPRCTRNKHCVEKESEGSKPTLFGCEQSFGLKNITVKVSNGTMEVPNHDEVTLCRNSEYSKDAGVVAGHVTNIELERSSNECFQVPSVNELTFPLKGDGIQNGTSKNLMEDRISESSSHELSCDWQAHGYENSMNKVSCVAMDQHKHKEFKSSCSGELHMAFDHGHAEQDVDVVKSTAQESCFKDHSLLASGNQQKFAMEHNVTGVFSSTLNGQKRPLADNLLCLSNSEQFWSVENNSNGFLTNKVREEPLSEDLNPKKNESVLGFSRYAQSSGNALSGFMWRTDEENDPISSYTNTSAQLVHSSGCFPTYDVMSDKGESELISGFEGLRSSNMENMEYNFMTSHSDESKVFTYNAEIDRGLDSSVWLEKAALPLLPKIANRRHVPTLCVWCRNEFHYETIESEAQIGSMGFTCAVCKAKFSGQFNLL